MITNYYYYYYYYYYIQRLFAYQLLTEVIENDKFFQKSLHVRLYYVHAILNTFYSFHHIITVFRVN